MNRPIPMISLVLAVTLLVAACSGASPATKAPLPPAATATALPQLSTAVAATGTALANNVPATVVPTTASSAATLAATAAASSTAAATVAATTAPATQVSSQPIVDEAILIMSPGQGSSVTSPVQVTGQADPTFEQTLVIQVTGADGTVLVTQPATIQSAAGTRGKFSAQVAFSVKDQQPGRISIFSTSARDGGLVHLASAEVTLLNKGTAMITGGQTHGETHLVQQPAAGDNLSGGVIHISGLSGYVFEGQLALELCGPGGSGAADPVCGTADNVLARGVATLQAVEAGLPATYAGMLVYHVSATGPARLAVYSRSARDGGLVHLSSVALTLAP
jgi:hypothetical protein